MTHALLSTKAGIPLHYANRHGLITGQTGTGKSVSLMRLAEQFHRQGVPVFVSDAKGDLKRLAATCQSVTLSPGGNLTLRLDHMSPDAASRALDLTDTQAACLEIAYRVAEEIGLPLATLADLRAILQTMVRKPHIVAPYGHATPASVSVIMRQIMRIESQSGSSLFSQTCFDVADLLDSGVTILQADSLVNSPRVYAALLLFLLEQLYSRLPEIGDTDKPRLVLFFDESHLLFQDATPALVRKIEQTVRLIRSKGVGVYFATQSQSDIPVMICQQLAHVVAHDRALPVGVADFQTMTEAGKPVSHKGIRVALPDCHDSDLADLPLSIMPQTQAATPALAWPEYLLLVVCLVAIVGAVCAVWLIGGKLAIAASAIVVAGLITAR